VTFICIMKRLETVTLKKSHGVAKVTGSMVGMLGALVFAFVKGPSLINHYNSSTIPNGTVTSTKNSVKGSITMLAANTCWCLWIIMQVCHSLLHFHHFTSCLLIFKSLLLCFLYLICFISLVWKTLLGY